MMGQSERTLDGLDGGHCVLLLLTWRPTLSQATEKHSTFPVPNTRLTCNKFQPFHRITHRERELLSPIVNFH